MAFDTPVLPHDKSLDKVTEPAATAPIAEQLYADALLVK